MSQSTSEGQRFDLDISGDIKASSRTLFYKYGRNRNTSKGFFTQNFNNLNNEGKHV